MGSCALNLGTAGWDGFSYEQRPALTGHSQPSKSPQEAPLPLSIGSSWDPLPPNLAEEVEKLIITIPLGEGAQWSRGGSWQSPGRAPDCTKSG